jgi:hypothetical protein
MIIPITRHGVKPAVSMRWMNFFTGIVLSMMFPVVTVFGVLPSQLSELIFKWIKLNYFYTAHSLGCKIAR